MVVPVLIGALKVWLPDSALVPDHAPLAVQVAAMFDVQVAVREPPEATVAGLTSSVAVGAAGVGAGCPMGDKPSGAPARG